MKYWLGHWGLWEHRPVNLQARSGSLNRHCSSDDQVLIIDCPEAASRQFVIDGLLCIQILSYDGDINYARKGLHVTLTCARAMMEQTSIQPGLVNSGEIRCPTAFKEDCSAALHVSVSVDWACCNRN